MVKPIIDALETKDTKELYKAFKKVYDVREKWEKLY